MRAPPENHGIPIEADQFGDAKACLDAEQQQGVIAPPDPCRPVGCCKEGLDLRSGQKMNLLSVVAVGWDGQNLLNLGGVRRLLERDEVEEGSKRREAEIAGSDAGGSLLFDVIEEAGDERSIEGTQVEHRRGFAELFLREGEQQSKRVPVRCDRVGTDIALTH